MPEESERGVGLVSLWDRQWQELDVGSFVQNRIKVANGVVAGKV